MLNHKPEKRMYNLSILRLVNPGTGCITGPAITLLVSIA